jgi:hypothetical protein
MLWIILVILCLIILIVLRIVRSKSYWEVGEYTSFWLGFCFACVLLGVFISGVSDYPYLAPKYKAIEAYRSRIQDIRNATYKNKNQDMIISGSLDNMQQSTNLSKYISEIAIKEAQYTEALEKSKIYKETFLTKFFADGLFISDKIYELPVK